MPCDSSYLEPNAREHELQRAAKLLAYVYTKLGLEVPKYVRDTARDIYARDDRSVMKLCDILHEMNATQIDEIVYDGRNKDARDLANWWEEHQAADRRREAEEERKKQQRRRQWLELNEEFGNEAGK